MGLISRHGSAPFANGETLEGPDLEQDISNLFSLVNGNIENANVKAGADINASKLLDGSIALAKLDTNLALNQGRIADNACTKHGFSSTIITSPLLADNTEQDVIQATQATAAAAGPVLVDLVLRLLPGDDANLAITWKLYRDAVLVTTFTWDLYKHGTGAGTLFPEMLVWRYVDTGASASSSHVYKITATPANTGDNPSVVHGTLRTLELRR